MGENNLGIYEGCYVELRNGEVFGPLEEHKSSATRSRWRAYSSEGRIELWYANHRHLTCTDKDIIRVLTPGEGLKRQITDPTVQIEPKPQPTIPPHVLQAAMGAGIKADPAYEQFVSAVLEAGIAAMGGQPVERSVPVDMDALCEEISSGLPGEKGFLERPYGSQEHIRNIAGRVMAFFGRSADPKNESENRILDSEKAKGGLSGITTMRTMDKVHPATAAFLKSIYPDAPLRAVEFHGGSLTASYGRPMNTVAEIEVKVSEPGNIPMWVEGDFSAPKTKLECCSADGRDFGGNNPMHMDWDAVRADIADHVEIHGVDFNKLFSAMRSMAGNGIPTATMVDETIRQCVTEWRRTNNGNPATPPSRYIAGAVHKMLLENSTVCGDQA